MFAAAIVAFILSVSLSSCSEGKVEGIVVAAASSLTHAFDEIGARYTEKTGVAVTFSYGATGDLARQIENGAPFDAFASADAEHLEGLVAKGRVAKDSRAIFAHGRLALWIPSGKGARIEKLSDVAGTEIARIAIAKPDIAPYGRASIEAFESLGLWKEIEPKAVYAGNVAQAKQFAATGNADAAMLPLSLVKNGEGKVVEVDEKLHRPVMHLIGVVNGSKKFDEARRFVEFVESEEGRAILERYGYGRP